jgi:hypothetical protein
LHTSISNRLILAFSCSTLSRAQPSNQTRAATREKDNVQIHEILPPKKEWKQRKGVIWMSKKDTKSRTEKGRWLGEAGEHYKTTISDSEKTRGGGGRPSEEAEENASDEWHDVEDDEDEDEEEDEEE